MAMTSGRIEASGTAAIAMIDGNVSRTYLSIQNTGSNTAYLGVASNLTSGTGIPLLAGDTFTTTIYNGSFFAIADKKAGILYIEEDR